MKKINILDDLTINKIAAGEVVERPASIVKELLENSIDANATQINIEIQNGGKEYIKVSDNGSGIDDEDVEIAFLRHTTSKLKTIEDIYSLYTNGFRGEALSSIASVSKVELTTNTSDEKIGKKIIIEENNIISIENVGKKRGTTVEVRDVFFNLPARKKFLKSDTSETSLITDLINKMAIANNEIAIKYKSNGKDLVRTIGDGSMYNAITAIYGKNISQNLINISFSNKYISINGYISKTSLYQSNKKKEQIFINKRYVKSSPIMYVIENVYKDLIPIGKYPIFFIDITIDAKYIDPNIHPAKLEVKISQEIDISDIISNLIREKLFESSRNLIPSVNYRENNYFNLIYDEKDNYKKNDEFVKETNSFKYIEYSAQEDSKEEIIAQSEIKEDTNISFKNNFHKEKNDYSFKQDTIFEKNYNCEFEEKLNYEDLKIEGILFNTYILASFKNSMYMIDQHAAHERVMYENIKEKFNLNNKKIDSQELLIANIIELPSNEHELVIKNKNIFERIGFDVDDFGYGRVALRSYPIIFSKETGLDFFEEIISLLLEGKKVDLNDTFEDKLAMMACKSAVKANQTLDIQEIIILLKKLNSCNNKYTCPHGRPIFIEFSKYEIEKMFKRIV